MKTTATVETASMETTAKARPAAGRKASYIAAMIKATECAGARTRLGVKRRGPASVERIATVTIEVAVIEISTIEIVAAKVVAIDDRSAMGDIRVVVIDR